MLGTSGFRKQMMILVIVIAGVFVFRSLVNAPGNSADDLSARLAEIDTFWHRVEAYPGTTLSETEHVTSSDYVVSERLYATDVPYGDVVAFYDKHLPSIGWEAIGEQRDWPGHISPIRLYRHRSFHLLVNTTDRGILLRMTWSANLDPMPDIRLLPN